jgi:hypothetical protein
MKEEEIEEMYQHLAKELNLEDRTKTKNSKKHKFDQSFHERVEYFTMLGQEKKEKIKAERLQKCMKECSFSPTVQRSAGIRKLEDFWQDQEKFISKKKEHINNMIEEKRRKEQEEPIGKPKINLRSQKKSDLNLTVYQRLYARHQSTSKKVEITEFQVWLLLPLILFIIEAKEFCEQQTKSG